MNDNLRETARHILEQLSDISSRLGKEKYAMPLETLSGNSIGKHIRHVIEFFDCMVKGFPEKHINYDRRVRDPQLETDYQSAVRALNILSVSLTADTKMLITLSGSYDLKKDNEYMVVTSFYRELVYNIEHSIHHMALIRIALKVEFPEIKVPADFGIAYSTIKHQEKVCAQ